MIELKSSNGLKTLMKLEQLTPIIQFETNVI